MFSGKTCSLEILRFLFPGAVEEEIGTVFPTELPMMASMEKEFDQEFVDFFPEEEETSEAAAVVVIVVGDPFGAIIITVDPAAAVKFIE